MDLQHYPYYGEEETPRRNPAKRFLVGLILGIIIGVAIGVTISGGLPIGGEITLSEGGEVTVQNSKVFTTGVIALLIAVFGIILVIVKRSTLAGQGSPRTSRILMLSVVAGLLLAVFLGGLVFYFVGQ